MREKRSGRNIAFIKAGIINLIRKNYHLSPDLFDISSFIDFKLTFVENWDNIKPRILRLCNNSKDNKAVRCEDIDFL
jgi:hypothetical protein